MHLSDGYLVDNNAQASSCHGLRQPFDTNFSLFHDVCAPCASRITRFSTSLLAVLGFTSGLTSPSAIVAVPLAHANKFLSPRSNADDTSSDTADAQAEILESAHGNFQLVHTFHIAQTA